jgi:glycosyltransferase involved in cell wall biosynthesis
MSPRVLIGVPAYKGAATLPQTLDSIQRQTYPDFRVLISIDGGDEESSDACEPFLVDPRFTLVRQPTRLGWNGNLRFLMDQCQLDFFCYWQQDDHTSDDYLEALLTTMDANAGAAIAYTDVQWFGSRDERESLPSVLGSARERVWDYLQHQHWLPLRGLIRTSLLHQVPGRFHLFPDSPWEHGFLCYLAGLGPLVRSERGLYFKRAHTDAFSNVFERRPLDQRRRDWVVRGSVFHEILEGFSDDWDARACLAFTVQRFATPRDGQFNDSPDPDPRAPDRFLRDWMALGGALPGGSAGGAGCPPASPAVERAITAAMRASAQRADPGGATSWTIGSDEPAGSCWLGYGWSHLEPWGVWSDAVSATLWLPPVPGPAELTLHVRHFGVAGEFATLRWAVLGRGSPAEVAIPCDEPFEWRLPIRPGDRTVELTLPSAQAPAARGLSSDQRVLGLGLSRITVQPRGRWDAVRRFAGRGTGAR